MTQYSKDELLFKLDLLNQKYIVIESSAVEDKNKVINFDFYTLITYQTFIDLINQFESKFKNVKYVKTFNSWLWDLTHVQCSAGEILQQTIPINIIFNQSTFQFLIEQLELDYGERQKMYSTSKETSKYILNQLSKVKKYKLNG